MFTLKQLHVGLINAHTLAWLVPNILSNGGGHRRLNCREPAESASLGYWGGPLGSWLDLSGSVFQKLGVLRFHWLLCKAEVGKKRAPTSALVQRGYGSGIPLCVSELKGLEIYFGTPLPLTEMHTH